MTYDEAVEFVDSTKKYGSILGLESIRNLMQELGNVQEQLHIIHVAGTNGKGSVCAFLSAALTEAGYRVGRYNSPAVFERREVFRIGETMISKEEYAAVFERVQTACEVLTKRGCPHSTVFEVETAAAFLWFYEKKCDLVLLETGMGGETDATNLITHPVCSVLTSIGMDHMQYLGNTIEEIAKVKELGVHFETNVVIGKSTTIDMLIEDEGFEAVFIGSGAGLPKFMGIPGENANGVFSANEYLTRSNLMKAFDDSYDTPIAAGKKVAVVGGGNVAMDAARTALRLGAEVHIVYRRSEEELPARVEEVHHAKEEGVQFDLLTNPVEVLEEDGWVKGIKCVRMELGEPDASGRRRPVPVEGSEFVIDVDTVIMSLGTSPNPLISSTTEGLEVNKWKCIVADEEHGKTSKEGVYAGGDAVTGAATVILAMGAGKAGARGIDEYLSNK